MLSKFSMGPDPSDRRVREDDVGETLHLTVKWQTFL
jgi:hypothetical protein